MVRKYKRDQLTVRGRQRSLDGLFQIIVILAMFEHICIDN